MPAALADFCRKTGQPAPSEPGAVVRCCLESLALRYRWVLEQLEELTGQRLDVIHVVGGGSQNALLCQLTADAATARCSPARSRRRRSATCWCRRSAWGCSGRWPTAARWCGGRWR